MPNPLTLSTVVPATAAKPEADRTGRTDPAKTPRFEDVLNQAEGEGDAETGNPEKTELEVRPDSDFSELREVAAPVEDANPDQADALAIAENPRTPRDGMPKAAQKTPLDEAETKGDARPRIPADAFPAAATRDELASSERNVPKSLQGDRIEQPFKPAVPFAQSVSTDGSQASPGWTTQEPSVSKRNSDVAERLTPKDPLPAPNDSAKANRTVPPDPRRAMVQMQLVMSTHTADVEPQVASEDPEPLINISEEPNVRSQRETATAAMTATPAARAEVSRAIAGQMAAAIQARPGSGVVEVALSPEELGRVSIILNGREDGFQVTIAAERPETLDLMRRHISVLATEFQKLGLGDLSIDLGTSADAQRDDANTKEFAAPDLSETNDDAPVPAPRSAPGTRMDMRL